MRRLIPLLILLTLGGFMPQPVAAQESTPPAEPTPAAKPDPETEALQRKNKIATLKKEIAEAEKAELAAKLPTTTAKGSDGSVTFKDGGGYFAELLAYEALEEAAKSVASQVKATKPDDALIVSLDLDLAQQAQLWEILQAKLSDFDTRANELTDKYKGGIEAESVAAALTTATALLGAAADVVAFFRSSTEISGKTITLSERALEAMVVHELLGATDNQWSIRDPSLSLAKTKLSEKLEGLLKKRADLVKRRGELEIAVQGTLTQLAQQQQKVRAAEARLARLDEADPPRPKDVEAALKELEQLNAELLTLETTQNRWLAASTEFDALIGGIDALVKAVTEGVEGKPSPLEAVAVIDVVKSNKDAKILLLDIASQGGEIHVSKSVWRTRLTYVGGTVVTYFLVDHEGKIEKAGTARGAVAKSIKAQDAGAELSF